MLVSSGNAAKHPCSVQGSHRGEELSSPKFIPLVDSGGRLQTRLPESGHHFPRLPLRAANCSSVPRMAGRFVSKGKV